MGKSIILGELKFGRLNPKGLGMLREKEAIPLIFDLFRKRRVQC